LDAFQKHREIVVIPWRDGRVDMVWHQHKRVYIVARSIEVEHARLYLISHIRSSQMAGAHASIQPFLNAADKTLFVFTLLGREPRFRMPSQPIVRSSRHWRRSGCGSVSARRNLMK